MINKHPKTGKDFEDLFIHHPVYTFFKIHTGLKRELYEDFCYIVSALQDVGEDLIYVAWLFACAMKHIFFVAIYPAYKLYRFIRLRNEIIAHPGKLYAHTDDL